MVKFAVFVVALLAYAQNGECAITWTVPASGSAAASSAIVEGTAVGPTVATLAASTDGQTAAPAAAAIQGYRLLTHSSFFSVVLATGVMTTAGSLLDYESEATLNVIVRTTDNAATAATSTATLIITVTASAVDPYFSQTTYCVSVADLATTFMTLSATTSDASTPVYAIAAGNTNTDFTTPIASGVLALATGKLVHHAVTRSYALVVTAVATSMTATTTVSICVGGSAYCGCTCSSSGATAVTVSIMTLFALLLLQIR